MVIQPNCEPLNKKFTEKYYSADESFSQENYKTENVAGINRMHLLAHPVGVYEILIECCKMWVFRATNFCIDKQVLPVS